MRATEVQADTKHEAAHNQAAQAAKEADDLLLRMEILEPGDYKLVAKIIGEHPELRDRIIAKAQEVCGNDTVAKALELLSKPAPAEAKAPAAAPAAAPEPSKTIDAVKDAKHGSAKTPDDFDYMRSPLILEYDRAEKIKDHIDFIKKNPQLRDKVMAGVAEFDPDLVKDIEKGLRGEASPQAPAGPERAPSDAILKDAQQSAPAPRKSSSDDLMKPDWSSKPARAKGSGSGDDLMTPDWSSKPAATSSGSSDDLMKPDWSSKPATGSDDLMKPDFSAEQKHDKPEAGWVARARAFNRQNWGTAQAFINIVGTICCDASGELDPRLVAQWQAAHGTHVDGRVGEATVAAAILDSPIDSDMPVAKAAPAKAAEAEKKS